MSGGAGEAASARDLYRTETVLRRELRVRYPLSEGRIVLRTDLDWDHDLEAASVSGDGTTFTFRLEAKKPFLYFKPCWRVGDETRWAVGANGLEKYPVLFMQDGKNLFFPDEAFAGRNWSVDDSLQLLDGMNAVDKVVVVGIHSGDRMAEYTKPGYEAYARSVVEEIVPEAGRRLRLIGGRMETAVMGSSLGGVVSFFMAFQFPETFTAAACLLSTFSHMDDLIERVLSEPKSEAKFYIDSGWPGDNFETTLAMAIALQSRGYVYGRDFLHFAFPLQAHEEAAWGSRLHLPLQLFWGKVSMAQRGRNE